MANIESAVQVSPLWKTAREWLAEKSAPNFPPLPVPALNSFPVSDLARGAITEIFGPRSSGRTAMSLHIVAQATQRGEVCALVDLHNAFAPGAALSAGVCLERLIWVRCNGNGEHAMRAVDLLLHAGGFGVVLLDLCDASPRVANRIPLSYWFRFQRAIQNTPAILLLCADRSHAQACSSTTLELESQRFSWSGEPPFALLRGIESKATVANGNDRPSSAALKSVA